MNQITTQNRNSPAPVVGIGSENGAKISPRNLEEVMRFAEIMSTANIGLPKHLRGNVGACMAVALQAFEWDMSPFAVASKSYLVNDKIAYEAQLIIAVVNTRSGIEGRLKYTFEGEGPERVCIADGKLDGEIYSVRSPKIKDIRPKNSPLWTSDQDQQHRYYTGRAWARAHTPEVILGVYDREEAQEMRDVTPQRPPLQERMREAKTAELQHEDTQEGFSEGYIEQATGEALDAVAVSADDGDIEQVDGGAQVDDHGAQEDGAPTDSLEAEASPVVSEFKEAIATASAERISELNAEYADKINQLPDDQKAEARAAVVARRAELKSEEGGEE